MKPIRLAATICELRKKRNLSQEQLACALHLSPQAVSKWETAAAMPDLQTLPLIADFFGVSLDYLFYGEEFCHQDIYETVFHRVAAHAQMSKQSYEDAFALFWNAHHGISRGNIRGKELYPRPAHISHISNEGGVSLASGKGYGAILTRAYFESIDKDTAAFAAGLLPALSDKCALLVCMAILSMSDISYGELQERLGFDDPTLRQALDRLIAAKLIIEKTSKHKALGLTYEIDQMYHSFLCILLATLQMQRDTLNGISCCMGYGDYPISL